MVTRFSPGVKYSPEMGVYSPDMNVRSGGNYTLYNDYAKLEAENKALKEAMQEFVDKVDRGQARSVKTYARFKELLDD